MAQSQSNTETQPGGQQAARSGAQPQSDERRRQGGEQQVARRGGALQRRSLEPFGELGFGGLSPFSLMRRMLEDMDRMFEGFGGARFERSRTGVFAPIWSPPIDVMEREGRFIVRADVPGLSPDDIGLEIRNGALVLEGERRHQVEEEGKEGLYRSERMYGRFSRFIPLPDEVDPDKASARFENGVLEIEIPLREEAKGRRIEIQTGSKREEKGAGPVH